MEVENFRNIKNLDHTFRQGFIVIAGENGAGKTNLLSALYFASSLRPFPESAVNQLFLIKENYFRLKVEVRNDNGWEQEVFVRMNENKYEYKTTQNGQPIPRLKFRGLMPIISFIPQDMELLTHGPSSRRRFLNEAISGVFEDYRHALSNYQRALWQRNALLGLIKNGVQGKSGLGDWDDLVAEYGSLIISRRNEFVTFINNKFSSVLEKIAPPLSAPRMVYRYSGGQNKRDFLEKLESAREKEVSLGQTVIGPHRDEFEITLEGERIAGFISRGQLRGIVLALKILEREFIKAQHQQSPIFLLDDIFSEFDNKHLLEISNFFKNEKQVFITTTKLAEVTEILPMAAQIVILKNGAIE